jgi:hypothetical protein
VLTGDDPRLLEGIEESARGRDRRDQGQTRHRGAAIDAVRKIGNIGAHMEKDINVIVDVEPKEAQLLIGLIELLVKDWYIAKHNRVERLKEIVAVSQVKEAAKDANP